MLKIFKEILTNTGPKQLFAKNNFKKKNNFIVNNLTYKSFGEKNKNKIFYVIRRYPTAGFFSNITFILNQLKISEMLNFTPVIDMQNYPTLYNENQLIKNTYNAWEYFFYNLNKYSLSEVYKSKNVFLSNLKFEENMALDMTNKSIRKYLKKIKVKKEINEKVKSFAKKNFNPKDKILGVHFRGSTYKTARGHALPPTSNYMIKNIENLIKKYNYNKIFIVTEEQKYLDALKKKFKKNCIFFPSFRMKNIDSFKIYPRKNHRFLLGEEILIETILLSKCKGLTYIKSNVISAALILSKKKINLHEIFLGYNSRNKYIANWKWFIKSILPKNLGGI